MKDKKDDFDLDSFGLGSLSDRYGHYGTEEDGSDDIRKGRSVDVTSMPVDDTDVFTETGSLFSDSAFDADGEDFPGKKSKKQKGEGFFKRNNHRNAKITALLLAILILLSAGGFMIYIYLATRSEGYGKSGLAFNDVDDDYLSDEELNYKAMGDVDEDTLNGYLKHWALNGGEKMHSKNVINVLLCGIDSEDGKAKEGRSDAMILVSVNKKRKTVTMVSFLRDSWSYMSLPNPDGTHYDYFFKMNAAYSYGGPATLIKTIENNFKIEIDEYISVDFVSFPKLIDAVGGVTVEVQDYEADFIRETSSQTDFPYGKAKLNGKQALIYSRIRHCDIDSDVSRTRRQRNVIKGLIASAKNATKGQLLNAFKQVSGYMSTGYSQSQVLRLIATAYSHNWMEFPMTELMLPNEDYVDRLSTYVGSQSAFVVDYALCAQKLQKALYGESNIILSEDRRSALSLVDNVDYPDDYDYSGSYSDYTDSGYDSGYYYDNDDDYGYDYGGDSGYSYTPDPEPYVEPNDPPQEVPDPGPADTPPPADDPQPQEPSGDEENGGGNSVGGILSNLFQN